MTRVLLTAFGPYAQWEANASWLALIEFSSEMPAAPEVTTRLYPVDFASFRTRLAEDMQEDYDYAIHLGQAPGSPRIMLEKIGINIAGEKDVAPGDYRPLMPDGPVAYRSTLPLSNWAEILQRGGIPAQVSYHAGTYLCNAALYLSCHNAASMGLRTQSVFIHVPLDDTQAHSFQSGDGTPTPTMPAAMTASALHLLMRELVSQ